MLFKNATIIKIVGDIPCTADAIQSALAQHPFVPARDMESERRGWVSPVNEDSEELVRAQGRCFMMSMKIQTKILPSSVIKEELKERMALRGMHGRKIRAKERNQMIEEIRFDLLPKAFSKYTRIHGYIDAERQEIVVGTASANQVDEFLASLRVAFDGLPVKLLESEVSPQSRMTHWAQSREAPPKVKFGQEIALEDPSEGGKGTFRKQDLSSDEILQCIESGKRVQRIALEWNDYLSFTVDERLVLRKLAPMDMFDEEFEGDDDENAKFDADFFMTVSGLRRLLPELYQWFDVKAGDSDDGGVYAEDEGNEAPSESADYGYEYDPNADSELGDFNEEELHDELDEDDAYSEAEEGIV
jgi:recombination associated protein RdgC